MLKLIYRDFCFHEIFVFGIWSARSQDWILIYITYTFYITTGTWFRSRYEQLFYSTRSYGIRNPFVWELPFLTASALMQIRCVSSSEIPLRSRRGPNEKSWMKNPFERQSQSSPVIRIFLQRALNRDPVSNSLRRRLSSRGRSKDLSERIGASCRLISNPTPESRDSSCSESFPSPGVAAVANVQSYNVILIC